jgi:hypothetical protein
MPKADHRDCGDKYDHRVHREDIRIGERAKTDAKDSPMRRFSLSLLRFCVYMFSVVGFDKTEVSNG